MTSYQIAHIAEYYRAKAMTILYGAGNPDDKLKVKYWSYIAQLHSAELLSR